MSKQKLRPWINPVKDKIIASDQEFDFLINLMLQKIATSLEIPYESLIEDRPLLK